MLTTVTILIVTLILPFIVHAGRRHISFPPNSRLGKLKRSVSAPTIPTAIASRDGESRKPKAKRRATSDEGGSEEVTPAVADGVVAEPEEDEGMLSDTSAESYVRFGRGMTVVDEKVGGGVVRSAVDRTP